MPDTRSHRGPDPADEQLFGAETHDHLRQATSDLCWLLNRGYALRSGGELVGNRYALTARQRLAVARCACSDAAAKGRAHREVEPRKLPDQELWIDGLNVLTGLEVALSGGVILIGCDGCCRDVAGIHRQYRKVEETLPGLSLVGQWAADWGLRKCQWWLDKPVSNSGRLKNMIAEVAAQSGWDWGVELVYSPDLILSKTEHIVASSDSVILDRCQRWLNLVRHVIAAYIPHVRSLDLAGHKVARDGCVEGPVGQE